MIISNNITIPSEKKTAKAIPDSVVGILFLITTELMFFAGIISAFLVNKAGMEWPPVGQPRLSAGVTAINTLVLLGSAYTLLMAIKKLRDGRINSSVFLLTLSIILGSAFLFVQGAEWVQLIGFGLTTTSSLYGAFFYLIIGAHGLHVFAGLILLVNMLYTIKKTKYSNAIILEKVAAFSLFWYFVVGIWPLLYWLVYLM